MENSVSILAILEQAMLTVTWCLRLERRSERLVTYGTLTVLNGNSRSQEGGAFSLSVTFQELSYKIAKS